MRQRAVRSANIAAALAAGVLMLGASRDARAFQAKHAASGHPVRWASPSVEFVLSPTLAFIDADAERTVARALAGWSGVAHGAGFDGGHHEGAPSLSTRPGDGSEVPAFDGKNVVYYAKDGYEKAFGALAITVLTYDDTTGRILDADVIINGRYRFAVVGAPDASRAQQAAADRPFDLIHVVAHEAGHALGLSDEPANEASLMFPYSAAGDPSRRAPGEDDRAGIAVLYQSAYQGGYLVAGTGTLAESTLASAAASSADEKAAPVRLRRASVDQSVFAPLLGLAALLTRRRLRHGAGAAS